MHKIGSLFVNSFCSSAVLPGRAFKMRTQADACTYFSRSPLPLAGAQDFGHLHAAPSVLCFVPVEHLERCHNPQRCLRFKRGAAKYCFVRGCTTYHIFRGSYRRVKASDGDCGSNSAPQTAPEALNLVSEQCLKHAANTHPGVLACVAGCRSSFCACPLECPDGRSASSKPLSSIPHAACK